MRASTAGYSLVIGAARVAKAKLPKTTWGSAVTKAADQMVTRFADAFLATVEAVAGAVPLKDLAAALEERNYTNAVQILDLETRFARALRGAGLPPERSSLIEVLQEIMRAGALAELEVMRGVPVVEKAERRKRPPSVAFELQFDLVNPQATQFLQEYGFRLIREVSRDSVDAIQEVLFAAFNEGGHPYDQARMIRNSIGLTQRQSQAVLNFRRMLEGDANGMRAALTRALRDHRFDATLVRSIQLGQSLPAEAVDRMVGRYAERYLKYRAETIARTETIRAAVAGQKELWRQAREQGLLDGAQTRRIWIVAPDERLCEICQGIADNHPDGVGLDEPFDSDNGPVMEPPAHPNCRCAVGLQFIRPGAEARP